MTNQPPSTTPLPDNNGIIWTTRKTKDGKDFLHGWKRPVEGTDLGLAQGVQREDNPVDPEADNRENDDLPVVGDEKWIATDPAVQDQGISRYALYFNGHPNVYSYTLDFTNTKGWSFSFIDESGDKYGVTTIQNGDHYLKYNSTAPTIKFVQREP
ncbi:hypothetical protein QBC34DRAFT_441682 [Podospora aff. communis PSN243]|uniref:Uncharacterized protein n=1 Tax=Podospora aff. communis PSN243 TaxID=3040156 RepID=A0AAV9GAM7_9PEZI|nr:hypothetical protein QBC34DRAFT_441682 [Podospora aff. communis PSN243]